jgi:hypothetical protein
MLGRKWNLVIQVIEVEKDRRERPRETEVSVRTGKGSFIRCWKHPAIFSNLLHSYLAMLIHRFEFHIWLTVSSGPYRVAIVSLITILNDMVESLEKCILETQCVD